MVSGLTPNWEMIVVDDGSTDGSGVLLRRLADAGRETDLWIMGGDQHCFGQYRSVVMPKMADWLMKKLSAAKDAAAD